MTEEYKIVYEEKPEDSAWGIIGQGVSRYNKKKAGDNQFKRLCYTLNDSEGEIAGGVIAEVYWDWLYIDLLWVQEDLRYQGYGKSLMSRVEDEARKMGARNAYLDTFSFQAPGFYEKLGYKSFGELSNFPESQQRFFMRKGL